MNRTPSSRLTGEEEQLQLTLRWICPQWEDSHPKCLYCFIISCRDSIELGDQYSALFPTPRLLRSVAWFVLSNDVTTANAISLSVLMDPLNVIDRFNVDEENF